MKTATTQLLNGITTAFYTSGSADEFSDSREHFWPGWSRVVARVPDDGHDLSVLDVGCGNGRFATFLSAAGKGAFRYCGVDISQPLLDRARARVDALGEARFIQSDIIRLSTEPTLFQGPFSLIVAFGVLHHVPSFQARQALLSALIRRLQPGGLLAVTFWRFGLFERFRRKMIGWSEHNRRAAQPVDLDDLEEGDCLIRWGTSGDCYRYCHFASDQEIEALIDSLGIRCADRFIADGQDNQLNHYLVISPT